MGEGAQWLDILLFALVAGFVVLRLRGVLGRRTGHEQSRPAGEFPSNKRGDPEQDQNQDDNVINLPGRDPEVEDMAGPVDMSPLAVNLRRLREVDPNFSAQSFTDGAKGAYEMIIMAFANGERDLLRKFLSEKVYENFESVIDRRENAGQQQETTLVGIREAEIIEADLRGKIAEVTVKFVSEMISVTRDDGNEVIDGDPSKINQVTDIWTFARNMRSRDPNWTLVATRSPH